MDGCRAVEEDGWEITLPVSTRSRARRVARGAALCGARARAHHVVHHHGARKVEGHRLLDAARGVKHARSRVGRRVKGVAEEVQLACGGQGGSGGRGGRVRMSADSPSQPTPSHTHTHARPTATSPGGSTLSAAPVSGSTLGWAVKLVWRQPPSFTRPTVSSSPSQASLGGAG